MKKLFFTFYVLLAMLTLTACGSSDKTDEPASGGSIVGTWHNDLVDDMDKMSDGMISGEDLYQFKSDGTWIWVSVLVYSPEYAEIYGTERDIDIVRGTYRVQGKNIYMTYTDVSDAEDAGYWLGKTLVFSYQFVGGKLKLTSTQGLIYSGTLTKVSDSSINQYL